jgi:hypothetical protein
MAENRIQFYPVDVEKLLADKHDSVFIPVSTIPSKDQVGRFFAYGFDPKGEGEMQWSPMANQSAGIRVPLFTIRAADEESMMANLLASGFNARDKLAVEQPKAGAVLTLGIVTDLKMRSDGIQYVGLFVRLK